MISRASRLIAASALLALSPIRASDVHALVFGDWGRDNTVQKEVAAAMRTYVKSHADSDPVQFAVLVGDNFYDTGVASTDDPQWKTKFEDMYDSKVMDFPFYAVLGNHDWGQDPVAQITYAQAHPGTRWQMPGFWYARSFPADSPAPVLEIFFVDTCLWTQNTQPLADKQLAWLRTSLEHSKARWKMVAGHHPIFSDGIHGREESTIRLRSILEPVFKAAKVDVYVAGHDHDLQRLIIPDHSTLFLVSGAASEVRPRDRTTLGPFHGSKPGFLSLQAGPKKLSGDFIGADGVVLDHWEIPPR